MRGARAGRPLVRPAPPAGLTLWFQTICLITQDKKGMSAMKLHRHLSISYKAAWRMEHKLMQIMDERDDDDKLYGFIEVDYT